MSGRGELEARNVSYRYSRAGPAVFDSVSIRARRGELLVLTGPSGCGKSTLLFLLGLMLRPNEGVITIGGVPLSSARERERSRFRARDIGFVFQDAALDRSRTILSNICEPAVLNRVPRREAVRTASDLLDQVGLDLPMCRRADGLSGGQAQRIALCRALICNPQFVLADEPTGNLDAESERLVLDRLQSEAGSGRTVVVVSHSDQVKARASRAVEIRG